MPPPGPSPPRMFSSQVTQATSPTHLGLLGGDDELQLLAVVEQGVPRRRHGGPAPQRRPAGVGAGHAVVVLPDIGHGVEVAGLEGRVERAGCAASTASASSIAGERRRRAGRPAAPAPAGLVLAGGSGRMARCCTSTRPTGSAWPSTTSVAHGHEPAAVPRHRLPRPRLAAAGRRTGRPLPRVGRSTTGPTATPPPPTPGDVPVGRLRPTTPQAVVDALGARAPWRRRPLDGRRRRW